MEHLVEGKKQRNLSEKVHEKIRQDILYGKWMPGKKLHIEKLSDHYGVGIVPLREALNRLSSDALVERKSNRGFYVSTISVNEMEELVKTRIWVETLALKESMQNRTESWEEQLIVVGHRLRRTARFSFDGENHIFSDDWELRHKDFHYALISKCGSALLLDFCSNLMDQAVRYRNISMNMTPSQDRREGAIDEHQEILSAVLADDKEAACDLLTKHYEKTLRVLRDIITDEI
jgi:GntR family carbon starvation induced transcriptional regulator